MTRPIQLLAAWLSGLVLVDSLFLSAAKLIERPAWAAGTLVVAAVAAVPAFLAAVFVLQTRFRTQMLEDHLYADVIEKQQHADQQKAAREAAAAAKVQDDLAELYLQEAISALDIGDEDKDRLRRVSRLALGAKDRRMARDVQGLILETEGGKTPSPEFIAYTEQKLLNLSDLLSPSDGSRPTATPTIDLCSTARRVVDSTRALLNREHRGIELTTPEGPVPVPVSRGIIEVVLSEILTNAVMYSPDGCAVAVEVSTTDEGQAVIVVENPVAPERTPDMTRVFDEGYRGPQSNERYPTGKGLGLAVARRLIEAAGGQVDVAINDNSPPRFSVAIRLSTTRPDDGSAVGVGDGTGRRDAHKGVAPADRPRTAARG